MVQLNPNDKDTVDALYHTRRAYHVELGAREKALLAEDPALKRFKSHKKSVNAVKRMGDVLTLAIQNFKYF
nr:isoform 2 of succinate dehydrogenase subunit 7b, mitochondrial [Quercus suber]